MTLRVRAARSVGHGIEAAIRAWVLAMGVRVAPETTWLPHVDLAEERSGGDVYSALAARDGVELSKEDDAGLLEDFDALGSGGFDPLAVDPRVRDFYEHTAGYRLAASPSWSPLFRPMGWTIIHFVSRRIDQLNIPLSPAEAAEGITNEILVLRRDGRHVGTGWVRRLATGEVVYAGVYGIGRPPNHPGPCVRVVFPLPRGSATVFLRPEAQPDGSLKLISAGRRFGDPGFYRIVGTERGARARYVRAFQETFHVYPEGDGLATDHVFRFHLLEVFRLRYRISRSARLS